MSTPDRPRAVAAASAGSIAGPGAGDEGCWLVFATGGPALDAAVAVGPRTARVVRDAADFRTALARGNPRLVIVSAPPARPTELASLAETRRRRADLRVVLIDPVAARDERLAALRAGFDEALPSSIEATELVGRVALLLARAADAADVSLPGRQPVAPGVELDLVAHAVRRDGRPVHLRPREFALLAVLARHPGRAFSREELLERAWGGDRDGRRTVDVHVRWLRAKIEPDPDHPRHLVTVRGLGYRLDPAPLTEP